MERVISPFREIADYEAPSEIKDCYFYHTTNLPRDGLIRGHWDLRGSEHDYLGQHDFSGQSFFDCGVASGFLSFEMERRGALVTGLDLDEQQDPTMGLIPHWDYANTIGISFDEAVLNRKHTQARLRNSFLYTRAQLDSRVKLMVGNIMLSPIPDDIQCDGAFFGAILLHLRDPVAAIYNVARNVRSTIIITENLEVNDTNLDSSPNAIFRPSRQDRGNVGTWLYMYPSFLKRVLEVAGFTRFALNCVDVTHDINGNKVPFFALVATR